MSESFSYCPICQLPLQAISISPELHVSQCMTIYEDNNNEECPQGVHCLSTDVFHYRDFTHKMLAAYRSSADFVPPDGKIRPSPKKRKTPSKSTKQTSPRKSKIPSKLEKKNIVTSDSESDTDTFIQTKKPRRNLRFTEKTEPPKTDSVKSPPKCVKAANTKRPQSLLTSKRGNVSPILETESSQDSGENLNTKNGPTDTSSDDMPLSRIKSGHKLTVVNVKLNAGEELTYSQSRAQSPLSSLSISTTGTSQVEDSDWESEATIGSVKNVVTKAVSKFLLKEAVLPDVTAVKFNSHLLKDSSEDNAKDNTPLIENVTNSNNEVENLESDTNESLSKTDFEDMIPVSPVNKELVKLNRKIPSPATTVHTCSEYDINASVSEDKESTEESYYDLPSSPEVVIPRKFSSKPAKFLTSSSDSDIPLASLVHDKSASELNSNVVKSKLRSRRLLDDENKVNEVKGKIKAGKVLRTPNKTPTYLNGSLNSQLPKSEHNASTDKDSDSGKSSGSKDASFVPSERSSSTHHSSDSAFSAESTDRLTSSAVSSSYTSSEENTYESRTSDPSYSEESHMDLKMKTRNKTKINRKLSVTPKKTKCIVKPFISNSESSSSEISIKEKAFFGGKKKSPISIRSPSKTKESKQNIKVHLLESTDSDDKSEWQTLLNKMRNSCFPSDLKIDSEDSLTVASSCSGSDTSHASTMLPPHSCPFYKKIPDTPFAVDAFQYWKIPGVKVYFLSHFHSDHYIGLKKNFSQPIYCTQITANLVRMKLRVDERWLRILELNKPQIICGVEVTALDANHCPGSVMLLFCLTNGCNYLHVGDFRASKSMKLCPSLQRIVISKLFLDTTYCSPQYCFPTQEDVIGKVVDIVRECVLKQPRTLVVCGSYTIGKEKVFLGIAEALNWKVWARPEKQRVFACLNNPNINTRLVKDPRSANIHVLPMGSIQIMPLQQHLQSCSGAFTHVIGIKPTGWELTSNLQKLKVTTRENITIYGVPYSEHSSFTELREFVQFLQPHEIVPTVNVGSSASRGKMSKHFSEWLNPKANATETQTKVSQYFKKC